MCCDVDIYTDKDDFVRPDPKISGNLVLGYRYERIGAENFLLKLFNDDIKEIKIKHPIKIKNTGQLDNSYYTKLCFTEKVAEIFANNNTREKFYVVKRQKNIGGNYSFIFFTKQEFYDKCRPLLCNSNHDLFIERGGFGAYDVIKEYLNDKKELHLSGKDGENHKITDNDGENYMYFSDEIFQQISDICNNEGCFKCCYNYKPKNDLDLEEIWGMKK